ncbi:unnamed protein product, partial [marine sediment metagenome]
MKKLICARLIVVVGILLVFAFPAMGRKFSFDLAKGSSVLFNYTITGAYNPLHLQISLV